MDVRTQIVIFGNPNSGNQQAKSLLSLNIQHYRLKDDPSCQIQIYNIVDDAEKQKGVEFIKELYTTSINTEKKEGDVTLHVWSAGGDGTLMGVVDELIKVDIDVAHPKIVFSLLPLGTGNDLSQVLGWGRRIPGHDIVGAHLETLNQLVKERLEGKTTVLDIWSVHIGAHESGWIQQAGSDEKKKEILHRMSNYSSIGLQGAIGAGFEKNRHSSRLFNILEYTKQALRNVVTGIPRVTNSVAEIEGEVGEEKKTRKRWSLVDPEQLKSPFAPVEMVIQNIPGIWGRHVDLWGCTEMTPTIFKDESGPTDMKTWTPQTTFDRKLEVYGISSVGSYIKKQISWFRKQLMRFGQFERTFKIIFQPDCHTHVMIDGEFFICEHPESMEYTHCFQIQILGPHDPEASRLIADDEQYHHLKSPAPPSEEENSSLNEKQAAIGEKPVIEQPAATSTTT